MTRDKMYKELGKLSSEGAFKTKYEKVELLGEGAAGKVHMAKNKVECDHVSTTCRRALYKDSLPNFQHTKEKVALKEINLKKINRYDHVVMEIQMLVNLKHPNLVNFKDLYLTKRNNVDILQIVMELVDGGALCNMLETEGLKLNEEQIAAILHEVSGHTDVM